SHDYRSCIHQILRTRSGIGVRIASHHMQRSKQSGSERRKAAVVSTSRSLPCGMERPWWWLLIALLNGESVGCWCCRSPLRSATVALGYAPAEMPTRARALVIGRIPTSCSDSRVGILLQLHHHLLQPPAGPLLQTIDLFDRGSHEPRDVACRWRFAGREYDLQVEPLIGGGSFPRGPCAGPRAPPPPPFPPPPPAHPPP